MTPTLAALLLCLSPVATDGDSVRCENGYSVRLWGISAVELREPGGREARDTLTRIISGRHLLCEIKGASFHRLTGMCWALGEDVAGEMVRAGQAKDWPKFSAGFYAEGAE